MAGMSLQGFLFTWLLVGILDRPANEAGFARSLAEFPPLLVLLLGGVLGDRFNGRTYLGIMHVLMALPPLALIFVYTQGWMGYWWVVLFGVAMASIQALSDPSRQAMLSRVARMDLQRAVTFMMVVTSLVGLGGVYLGGRLDVLGLPTVLTGQALMFLLGIFAVRQLPSLPQSPYGHPLDQSRRPRPNLAAGFKAVWSTPLIRNIIGLNFLSSLFNAGAYIIAIPYIAKEVYQGDAAFLATVMIVFTTGSIGSNVLLLLFMPLKNPGRLFLVLQLTRMFILGILWLQPSLWLFYVVMVAWGLNMGVTTTLVRTTVQELAPETYRAQILSVLLLSFMVSSPISSILLGVLIAETTPLAAMLPGIVISLLIFVIGVARSGLWGYTAPGARSDPEGARSVPE
jgi:predicted MFS family arabinose efflux permease